MTTSPPLGNATDTWTDGRTGYTTKNYGTTAGLNIRTGSGDWRTWIYWSRPFPLGATIISASIKFYTKQSWASGVVVTAQRAAAAWSVNKITHANQPGVTGVTASTASLGALVAGAEVNIDVTAIMQAIATGSPWYGLRITATGTANKSFHSAQTSSRTLQPVLTVTWSDAPDAPKQFFPDGNRAVVSGSPMLRSDFTDVSGDQAIGAMQVQVDAAANWTSPGWDSGTWPVSAPELNLADFLEILQNTSFDVDLTNNYSGWVAGGGGTITRVTTPVHSGAGAVQLTHATGGTCQIIASATGLGAIPIVAGRSYTFSGWVRTAVTARSVNLQIDWYDSAGAFLSNSIQSSTPDTTTYVQRSYTATAPAGAAFGRPYFNFAALAAGEIHYMDDAHFGVTAVPFTPVALNASTYWRVRVQDGAGLWSAWSHTVNGTGAQFKRVAKPTIALTNPSPNTVQNTNYVGNPGQEANQSGYVNIGNTTYVLTLVADTTMGTGANIGRQTVTTPGASGMGLGWQSTRVFQPGTYTFGILVRPSATMTIRAYTEGSATLSPAQSGPNISCPAGVVTLLTSTITVATAGTLKPGYLVQAGTFAAADYVEFDCLGLFDGASWPGYFDGSTADNAYTLYDWVGTAQLSESTKTSLNVANNVLPNPDFEGGSASGWSQVGGATNTVPAAGTSPVLFGTRSMQSVCIANSGPFVVGSTVGGSTYSFSAYIYPLADTTVTITATQGAPVGGAASIPGSSATFCPANTWTRLTPLTGVTPTVETSTNFIMKSSAATTIYVDGAIAAPGAVIPPFFSGGYAPPGYTSFWNGTVNNSASWLQAATVNEPTPPISWTATSQKSWQVLVVDANQTSKVYWDSGKITSGATNTTPSTAAFKDSTKTYKIILRVWDAVDREQNGTDPVYTETSIGVVYQYVDAVNPVTGLTMTQLTDMPCAVLNWSRASAPDGWSIYRDGILVEEKLGLDLFISGTTYQYKDCGADPRVTHTWIVMPIVNNKHSNSNPTVSGALTLRAPILMRTDGTDAVALLNPDIPFTRQSNQELHDPLGNVPPVLITQSLKGNAGHAKGLISSEGFSSGVSARTQRDRFDSIRNDSGIELRLVRADENIKVVAYNMTYDPRSNAGVVDYVAEFDFVQVDF